MKALRIARTTEFAPQFPPQQPDFTFGVPQGITDELLVGSESNVRLLVPTADNGGDQLGQTWVEPGFDDSSWMSGVGGVGYEAEMATRI